MYKHKKGLGGEVIVFEGEASPPPLHCVAIRVHNLLTKWTLMKLDIQQLNVKKPHNNIPYVMVVHNTAKEMGVIKFEHLSYKSALFTNKF